MGSVYMFKLRNKCIISQMPHFPLVLAINQSVCALRLSLRAFTLCVRLEFSSVHVCDPVLILTLQISCKSQILSQCCSIYYNSGCRPSRSFYLISLTLIQTEASSPKQQTKTTKTPHQTYEVLVVKDKLSCTQINKCCHRDIKMVSPVIGSYCK